MLIEPTSDKTTFREVKVEILRRITDGPWGPGTQLPGEVELAQEFGCSRTTINRAMRELAEQGLIDRRRKSGTRVRMAPIRQARFEIPIVRVEIENLGATYRYALVSRAVLDAPDWLRARMNIKALGKVIHVICIHYANSIAFQLEDRWINASALPQVVDQPFDQIGPNEWLIAAVPFSEVEISFLAKAASGDVVSNLDFQTGEPVFCVERTTWWQGAAITHVSLSYCKGHRMTTRY
jgi:GntR family transcriptional regulator, histidine utilization repressor